MLLGRTLINVLLHHLIWGKREREGERERERERERGGGVEQSVIMDTLGLAICSFIQRLPSLLRSKCTSIIGKGPQSVFL